MPVSFFPFPSTVTSKRRMRSYGIVFLPVLARLAFVLTSSICDEGWEWTYNTWVRARAPFSYTWMIKSRVGSFVHPCLFTLDIGPLWDLGSSILESGSIIGVNPGGKNMKVECTTVVYSLDSACRACSGASYYNWSEWSLGCAAIPPDGTYPFPISNETRVPHGAYLPVMESDRWNVTLAEVAGDSPEVTPTPVSSFQPSSTSSVISQSLSASPSNQNKPHAKHGHIAGAIVGGVISVVLLIAVIFWRCMRAESRPSPSVGRAAPPDASRSIGRIHLTQAHFRHRSSLP
ncbi:hypothetical protein F5148DRAFT_370369 [Russula earlei]|uniref:Uncharacterized protein n=1 Tax=Russula earlei TaxID=71964 RepID=A0ACC0U0P1_9AGAM|nr:hypothetical protein F5148DRAFT_370369 [Russula earlei]